MKKNKLVFGLLASILLVGCSSTINAEPGYLDDPLINIGSETIYDNEFQLIYDEMVKAGSSNTQIVDAVLLMMAKNEIGTNDAALIAKGYKSFAEVGFVTEAKFKELIEDYMVKRALSGSYSKNNLFQEEKMVREYRTNYYKVKDANGSETEFNGLTKDVLLVPEIEYKDLFKADYSDYTKKVVEPIIYRRLLTAKYLYENKYKSLGRASARDLQIIKLENNIDRKGAAISTLNNYIGGYLYYINNKSSIAAADVAKYVPSYDGTDESTLFDLDSLARIWKGNTDTGTSNDSLTNKETAFIGGTNMLNSKLYTMANNIEEEISRIADKETDGSYTIKNVENIDSALLASYTGSNAYPVEWGEMLAKRQLASKDIVENDLFTSKGLSDLPSSIRDRLFKSTVDRFLVKPSKGSLSFLLPEKTYNTGESTEGAADSKLVCSSTSDCVQQAANLIHYDSTTSTYYVVIVDAVYTTTSLVGGEVDAETAKPEVKEKAIEIATLLGEDSTNQKDGLIHFFKETNLKYHDQDFYDYLKNTYPDIFED